MAPPNPASPLRFAFWMLLTLAGLGLSACGHTEAAPPPVPMATVMQAIHDYGRGHEGISSPAPAGTPDTGVASYMLNIRNLLEQGNYSELEKIAQINRVEKGRFAGGNWKNNDFFNAVSTANSDNPTDNDYRRQFEQVNKWVAARPDSAAAKIALAHLYLAYADFARGSGYADSVSDSQWDTYRSRTALAKQALLEAARLKERDPHWYMAMQYVAHNEGWDKADARELLDQALAFEPDYFHYYRLYANYLLPQWYGEHGEIPAFAEATAAKHPEPNSSILYFQIVSSLACYRRQESAELKATDWAKLQSGFANLQKMYGLSDLNANRFAEMAYVFGDKAVAREAFSHVIERNSAVWLTQDSFDSARNWANAP